MSARAIRVVLLGCLISLWAAPAASAEVKRAGGILPPGQSGFVSQAGLANGTGSPHLTDQTPLFLDFKFKPLTFTPGGSPERPRPGVTIARDAFGVPTINADSSNGLWFGAGYAVAQDRLFQLELFRRATKGRLSEALGKTFLQMDIQTRRDFFTEGELQAQLAKLPPELSARFDGYRDGINAWIAETRRDPNKLPGEFTAVGVMPADWTVTDSTAIGVFLARTVPSDDGEEMANVAGLKKLGPKLFDKLLPLRIKGDVATVPRSEGLFPQPGRTVKQERRAFLRSQKFVAGLPVPAPTATGSSASATSLAQLGRPGGSNMWAIRSKGKRASLFNGPQLGFQIPELFVELELHGPGLDIRGVTAPGVPVIGIGHNGRIAFGLTSGLSDDDDLYVEQLTGPEEYRFKGQTLKMDCRNETFTFRPPPSNFIPSAGNLLAGKTPDASTGSQTERFCRTIHGPVQDRAEGVAFARRFAIFGREVETLEGLAEVNAAKTIQDVDRAVDKLTWNENLMAADDQGNIGYWHPGLLPLKPRNWDERLPFPGTGEAEWRGLLSPDQRPQVINPKQGYLVQWNNVPSVGWTTGDGPARERVTGPFHRAAILRSAVRSAFKRGGGYDLTADVDKRSGTIAQQRPQSTRLLKRARKVAKGESKSVLDTILSWSGSYDRTDSEGKVDPGVAAWEAFKASAAEVATGRKADDLKLIVGGASNGHAFDITNSEAYALRRLSTSGLRRAAGRAFRDLEKKFSSRDPSAWRDSRRIFNTSAQGAGNFPDIPFFDRGTWQQVVELGP